MYSLLSKQCWSKTLCLLRLKEFKCSRAGMMDEGQKLSVCRLQPREFSSSWKEKKGWEKGVEWSFWKKDPHSNSKPIKQKNLDTFICICLYLTVFYAQISREKTH